MRKRRLRGAALLLGLLLLLSTGARATDVLQEEAAILGADSLRDGLTEDAAEALEDVSPTQQPDFAAVLRELLLRAWNAVSGSLPELWRGIAQLLAVTLLCGMASLSDSGPAQTAARVAGCLGIAGLCTSELSGMAALAEQTLGEIGDFSALLVPVLASALTASGGVGSGGALYAGTVLFISILTRLIRSVLIPAAYAYLFLAAAQCAIGDERLERLRTLCGWGISTALKAVVGLFTAYLTLTGLLAGASDEAALRAAKSVLSTAIPVVGGIISDASQAVLTSAGLIRNAAGAFGLLGVLAMGLTPFLRLAVQYLMLKIAAAVAFWAQKEHGKLLECAAAAMGYMLAMVGSGLLMVMVSICCFVKAVNG